MTDFKPSVKRILHFPVPVMNLYIRVHVHTSLVTGASSLINVHISRYEFGTNMRCSYDRIQQFHRLEEYIDIDRGYDRRINVTKKERGGNLFICWF